MKNAPLHAVLTRFGIIAAVLATLMLIAPGTAAQTVPVNPTTVNYLEGGEGPVARYQAAAPGGKPFSWGITSATDDSTNSAQAASFKIGDKTGLLEFNNSPNYEDAAAPVNNAYLVQVVAKLDDAPAAAPILMINVTVNVLNKDEVPEIQLTARQPENGVSLGIDGTRAATEDEDAGDDTTGSPAYQWATSPDGTTAWSNISIANGGQAATYTPVGGDVGKYLRVTLTYDGRVDGLSDSDATRKSIVAKSDAAVQDSSITNAAPEFDDTDSVNAGAQQTRNLPENTEAGENVGAPVRATDDRGLLTYSISGGTDQGAFEIDRATGQLTVGTGTMPDAEDGAKDGSDEFVVNVTATDGAGATGTVTVTIDVDDLNEPPVVTSTITSPTAIAEDLAGKALQLTGTVSAADPDQVGDPASTEVFTWSISDETIFSFTDNGANPPILTLSVNADVLDFETATMHEVDVIATDKRGMAGKATVKITVTNANEDGSVTFTTQQPQVGVQLTAILEDDDGPASGNTSLNPTWVWARADAAGACATASYTMIDDDNDKNADATNASYTPIAADDGRCLRATATYLDGQSADANDNKTAVGATANPTLPKRQANYAPVFKDAQGLVLTSAMRAVKEDAGAGDAVGDAVTASDEDANDKSTYSLGGADEDSFSITPDGGQIQVGEDADLDFETKTSYSVTVTATDGNTASATIPVTIMIEDVNEAPTVTGPATAEVAEYTEQKGMTVVVGSYTATDVDAADRDANDNTVVAEWKVSGADSGSFEISDDGELAFGEGKPDYDNPADSTMENEYVVSVVAVDSDGNEGTTMVTVTVTNEEEPGSVSFDLEQPGVGIEVTASAMDDDSADDTSAATWQWSSSDTEDGEYTDIDGETNAAITPSADEADMWLRATATYNGKSVSNEMSYPVKAYTAVNALPVWADQDPNTSGVQTDQMRDVAENSKAGTNVGAPVDATDSDDIDVLTYTLTDGEYDAAGVYTPADTDGDNATPSETDGDSTKFDIDQASGQLSVKSGAMLDHETKDTYVVRVTATDGSGAPASVKVTINVTDANDDPVIDEETTVKAATAGTAAENTTTLTPTAPTGGSFTYTATDQDTFDAEVKWALEGPDASAFTITGGVLAFKSAPDFEAKETYKVTVVANDYDDRGSRDTVDVEITVTNVNETGVITISTQQPQVDVPFIATLSDPDGIDGDVTWKTSGAGAASIVSNDSTSASITYTPKTAGSLSIAAAYADNEAAGQSLTQPTANDVRAKQSSNRPPMFDDQDSDTPGTQNDQATRTVPENSAEDTQNKTQVDLGAPITATDPDTATNTGRTDVLTYALSDYEDGSGDSGPFKVVASSGQIQVDGDPGLDFESGKTEYMVKLTATDGSGATATIKVIITVTDVDEAPVLTTDNNQPAFDEGEMATRMVDENTAAGEYIGDPVGATDPDLDPLTYTLGGHDADSFGFDESSGQLMTMAALDYEMKSSYMVTVSVSDGFADDGSADEAVDATITVTIMVGNSQMGCDMVHTDYGNGLGNDCEALLDSKSSLDMDGSSLNWTDHAHTPMSDWDGLRISGDPMRVTQINLSGENLDGTIPASLGRLSALTHLNLRSNENLGGAIPDALGDLSNLRVLNLHSNSHTGPIPDLSGATMLEELYLPNNHDRDTDGNKVAGTGLTGGVPAWLNGMTNMTELWLWGNSLSGPVPDLSGMTSLDKLKLNWNELDGGVPAGDMLPPDVTWLILDRNDFGGEIPDLSGLSSLFLLWLWENGLTGEIPDGTNFPASLDDLNLRDNMLEGEIPDLSNLDNLTRLRLHNNMLTGEVPGSLGGLDSLERLWLHNEDASKTSYGNNAFTSIHADVADLADTLTHMYVNGIAAGACLPGDLADVMYNDFDDAGIAACQ